MKSPRTSRTHLLVGALAAASLALAGCGGTDTPPAATPEQPEPGETTEDAGEDPPAEAPSLAFAGPNGEVPASFDELSLTDDEIEQVRAGGYTVAFVWHESSSYVSAVEQGATAMFEDLGIEVVASTEAGFDAARQADNLQSVMALDPDIIVTIAVDPTSAAAAFQPAVDAGIKIAVMTTPPAGYVPGDQIVSIVTGSLTEYGQGLAQILSDELGGTGQVGYLYHDADFWFTNQRDQAFKDWLAYLAPDIEIVEEAGFTDPARTEDIANAILTRNPDLAGVYVAWATAADGVLAALRNAGRDDVKIVTNDLDVALASDMARGGNIVGLMANGAVQIGEGLAIVGAYGVLDKEAPALVATHPVPVVADTIEAGWLAEFAEAPPAGVLD